MFKLVIQDDEGKTTVVPLIRDEITIGRKEGNTIRLTERNVSRRHARILRNNGEVSIEDLGSYNGIRVNNARIAERVALRVSDQVQIGDYKLYLKAEGTDQPDDSRTMPLERVEGSNPPVPPTEQMAVATPTPTAQVPVVGPTPLPGTLPAAPKLVGDPNRTLVAIADTDPHGRPIATAAAITALTATPGYGRLVVLSSNFAGKEFELSRPQMIIGRTDENDLVINHRSISRNHAKVVREPDTGRYTISDLQSSNGVRVNGQDYGKVELRRGDVIDLGHVRLRFIEPGEDFVFSRDAVITDVPESGSRKGVLLFVGLAILALAFAVVWMVKGGGGDGGGGSGSDPNVKGGGTNSVVTPDGPAVVAQLADASMATTPIDANDSAEARLLTEECNRAVQKREWEKVSSCAEKLKSQELSDLVKVESTNEALKNDAVAALRTDNLVVARQKLTAMKKRPDGSKSPYDDELRGMIDKKADDLKEQVIGQLRGQTGKADCAGYNRLANDLEKKYGPELINSAKSRVRCVEQRDKRCPDEIACDPTKQECVKGKCEPRKIVPPPPVDQCATVDIEALKAKANASINNGAYGDAYKSLSLASKCKPGDPGIIKLQFLAACKTKDEDAAKRLWPFVPAANRGLKATCVNNGMNPDLFP